MTHDDPAAQPDSNPSGRPADHWLRYAHRLLRRLPVERRLRFVASILGRQSTMSGRHSLVEDVQARLQSTFSAVPGPPAWPGASRPPEPPAFPVQGLRDASRPARAEPSRAPSVAPGWPQLPAYAPSPERHAVEPDSPADGTAADEAGPLPPSVAHSQSLPLDPNVGTYMARTLDLRIPSVRIYANQAADQVARRYRADAVTYGRSILFRAGKYNPATRQGLSLLGHELTHAAQTESAPSAPVPAPASYAAVQAERAALQNEQGMLDRLASPERMPPDLGVPMPAAVHAAPAQPSTPRAAAVDRPIREASGANGSPSPASLSAAQLQQIKDSVYRDLLERIRTEFERGG